MLVADHAASNIIGADHRCDMRLSYGTHVIPHHPRHRYGIHTISTYKYGSFPGSLSNLNACTFGAESAGHAPDVGKHAALGGQEEAGRAEQREHNAHRQEDLRRDEGLLGALQRSGRAVAVDARVHSTVLLCRHCLPEQASAGRAL